MLPAGSRLRHRAEFTATVRGARPCRGDGLLVVHAVTPDRTYGSAAPGMTPPSKAGLVVARSVGSAVTRNRVKRRLRHLLAPRLAALPAGTAVVVRALPGCATASVDALAAALDVALARAVRVRTS